MTSPTRLKIYGPPGSGKTKKAIDMVCEAIRQGDKAVFTSFTKKASNEARSRVPSDQRKLVQVSTLHSLSFKDLDFKPQYVISNLTKFGKMIGEVIEEQEDKSVPRTHLREILAFLATWRNKRVDPSLSDLPKNVPWELAAFVIERYRQFKLDEAKVDYTDFLTTYIEHGHPLGVQHMFVDEAQDLTALQWRVIEKMSRDCQTLSVFGDDDQAIFTFAGSQSQNLLEWSADQTQVLDYSHRLPEQVYRLSQDVIQQVRRRYNKTFRHNGDVGQVSLTSTVNFDHDFTGYDTYAILYRNHSMSEWIRDELHKRGIPYISEVGPYAYVDQLQALKDWERWRTGGAITIRALRNIARYTTLDLQAYDTGVGSLPVSLSPPTSLPWHEVLKLKYGDVYRLVYNRHGVDGLIKRPSLTLSTIHHAKGGEWDKVMLLTDMSKLTYDEYMKPERKEDEDRVWYVGTTRAKQHLQLIRPQRVRHYPLLANYPLERLS